MHAVLESRSVLGFHFGMHLLDVIQARLLQVETKLLFSKNGKHFETKDAIMQHTFSSAK